MWSVPACGRCPPCFGGVRYIIDLTIAWASAAGAVEWRNVGWDADQRAKAKRKSYEEAMERERQGQAGWFPELRLQSTVSSCRSRTR